ncbi:DUF2079 domain-containing protein [Streptococcus chenjunshii]|uniref:DUF2079 domain-containing protein n=1 Tax=Streptococcus chenjunshii TaxID=2173853 RepID=A0A372KMK2_9STRE|nr:DUF2079 domain-containing protein [Streptococcus chenjunshii]AXQ79597.1 DUF2079 domain-containing protein [Streptococcus chenjunshii]RFU51512.1 DUF2079 domain-containing protein [Streptococcus chenjunshii]RFU53507.1 DUF2079 domain-containing protein [Streptococcus chenjunshii]
MSKEKALADRTYSRVGRREQNDLEKETAVRPKKPSTRVLGKHKFSILLFSIVLAVCTVALPLFTDLANSVQSQNLYTGLMMTKGQLPYSDIFATGGFFYYVLIAFSYLLGSTVWLLPVQFLAMYISGIYLYKTVRFLTASTEVAYCFICFFYLLNGTLGFGGLYPVQWAMPFVLIGLWFLTKYFADITTDEAFILYGFAGALSILFEPRTLVFWVLSFVTIAVYNLSKRHLARGFYQLLCIIFGVILVIYFAVYFLLNLQILSSYIAQAVIYQFTFFASGNANLWLSLLFQVFLALASGLLLGVFALPGQLKRYPENKVIKWLICLVFLAEFTMLCLVQDFQTYHLLGLLPFGLILTALRVNTVYQARRSWHSHRRKKTTGVGKIFGIFLGRHAYLPLLVALFAFAVPLVSYAINHNVNQERETVAEYLKQSVSGDNTVYVWDRTAKIYLTGELASSSQFSLPSVYTAKAANAKILEDELLQNGASYVVVNNSQSISETLRDHLLANYDVLSLDGLSAFTIYQIK